MKCKSNRIAFTLVELLVVISIISVLASMFLLAYRGAQQETLTQKTRTTIQKLGTLLSSLVDEYSNEPLTLAIPSTAMVDRNVVQPHITRDDLIEQARLLAMRDRLRLEMPDHPDDIKWTRSKADTSGVVNDMDGYIVRHLRGEQNRLPVICPRNTQLVFDGQNPRILYPTSSSPPGRALRLLRKLSVLDGNMRFVPRIDWEVENANAELLFLIVEDAVFDGSSALELFGNSEIGDTDRDGLKEFVDAFGKPISWIRWPSGFAGVAQAHPDPLDPALVRVMGNGQRRLAIGDEPYDGMGRDPGRDTTMPSSQLGVPLVVSAGPDGRFGIRIAFTDFIPQSDRWWHSDTKSTADCVWSVARYGANPNIAYPASTVPMPDPWYPRNEPHLRLGSLLQQNQKSQDSLSDPLSVNPSREASDNITNLEGTAASL